MVLIFIFLTCVTLSRAQTSAGLDLSSLLFKELKIVVGHRITEHWSVSAYAGLNMKVMQQRLMPEEAEHNETFPPAHMPANRPFMHREAVGFCYWPQSTFSGPFLSVGGEYRQGSGLDATLGIGYMLKIWKGLIGFMTYDAGIIRTANTGKLPTDGFSAGICWVF